MAETFINALIYGCYVVTTCLNGRRFGMTCCWATQIYNNKVILCMGGQSSTRKAIRQSKVFGVNVLTVSQKELALHFGKGHSSEIDKFDGVATEMAETGVPLLPGSLKTLACRLDEQFMQAYENIVVGTIVHFRRGQTTEAPLLLEHINPG